MEVQLASVEGTKHYLLTRGWPLNWWSRGRGEPPRHPYGYPADATRAATIAAATTSSSSSPATVAAAAASSSPVRKLHDVNFT